MDKYDRLNSLEKNWKELSQKDSENEIILRKKLIAAQALTEYSEKHPEIHQDKEDRILVNEAIAFAILYGDKVAV